MLSSEGDSWQQRLSQRPGQRAELSTTAKPTTGRPRVHIVDHYLPRSVDKPSTPRKMMNLHSSRRDDRRKTKPSYGPKSERRCRGIVIVVSLLDLGLSTSSAGDQLLWKGDTPTSTNTTPVEYSVLVTNIPPCVNRVSFCLFDSIVPSPS